MTFSTVETDQTKISRAIQQREQSRLNVGGSAVTLRTYDTTIDARMLTISKPDD
jgi:hypothetical protein